MQHYQYPEETSLIYRQAFGHEFSNKYQSKTQFDGYQENRQNDGRNGRNNGLPDDNRAQNHSYPSNSR